ncbi:MAG TPA: PHP domain-containing protein [Acidiferrobacteraceae bacterium]|nr:PHP domain-containing protein [Acidiferrobacteraceae bacterium]
MALYYDLHTHTYHSDGLLAPAELVQRARAAGLGALALTDHDGVAGLPEAAQAAEACGLVFVPGIEISVTWGGQTVHIVGLGVDPHSPGLQSGIRMLQGQREDRARAMARQLAQAGLPGMYEGAAAQARGILGRLHFARALVAAGAARDPRHAFSEFLGQGRPAYVRMQWAELGDAIGWIIAAGGLAVIAHPARYRLSAGALKRFLTEFQEAGGHAIEVVSSSHSDEEMRRFALLADQHKLLASAGSDFHAPGESRLDVGCLPELPPGCTSLWTLWESRAGKSGSVRV